MSRTTRLDELLQFRAPGGTRERLIARGQPRAEGVSTLLRRLVLKSLERLDREDRKAAER